MSITRLFISLFLAALALTFSGCGTSKPKDPQKAYEDSIAYVVAKTLLERQQFVLTASRLQLGNSRMLTVSDANNFIMVDGNDGTIQMSLNYGLFGPYTAKGTISNYKYTEQKNGDATATFRFNGRIGSGDVRITVSKKAANDATGYVDATFSRGRSAFFGAIYSIKQEVIKLD